MTESEKKLVKKLRGPNSDVENASLCLEAAAALEKCEKTGVELLAMRDAEIDRLRDIAFKAIAASISSQAAALIEIAGDPDE